MIRLDVEAVFKALADETRRAILDLLADHDGRSLHDIEGHFQMSRFGVMKHLKVLEEAELITTRKVGREKLHYLNPVPIQLVYDRWVSRYAQPFSRHLTSLKLTLEERPMHEVKPRHVYSIVIRTTPERLWEALTTSAFTRQYFYGADVDATWQSGGTYTFLDQGGNVLLHGDVLEADPPRTLRVTFHPAFIPGEVPPTSVTYRIQQDGELCTLTLTHEGLNERYPGFENVDAGWNLVLSGLKTLLETGSPLLAPHA
jgi:DNA-binding transcriptional ArsR family regulator/uncharacterized protein YndB with AHSA1/START domain